MRPTKVGPQRAFRGRVPDEVHLARGGGACPEPGILGLNLVYYRPVFFKVALLRFDLVNPFTYDTTRCPVGKVRNALFRRSKLGPTGKGAV